MLLLLLLPTPLRPEWQSTQVKSSLTRHLQLFYCTKEAQHMEPSPNGQWLVRRVKVHLFDN